jgi:hypothetical protein
VKLNPIEAFFTKKMRVFIKNIIGEIRGELICPYIHQVMCQFLMGL